MVMTSSSGAERQYGSRIQDYGIIGDCRSVALISRDGSLDWLCWPRLDSPAVFAALLDPKRGGRWQISIADLKMVSRSYVAESNVLQTTFESGSGKAVLTDLMPVSSEDFKHSHYVPDHELLRQVECTSGSVQAHVEFQPRCNYGQDEPRLRQKGKLGLQFMVGRGVYWLRSSVPLTITNKGAVAQSTLRAGEKLQFSLTYSEHAPAVLPRLDDYCEESICRSVRWWQAWARRAKYDGPYREDVVRSALALKLLTYAPSGAIVAAATTSLPERAGGDLNWDYRYCWLRDASLTIRALLGLGYVEEADAFMNWMLYATRLTQPELRIMYDVFGELAPRERELDYLSGYENSRPVRVGNGARHQLQLDVYGEVIDAAAQYPFHGGTLDRTMQRVLVGFGKYVVEHWDQPDEGIWEPRSGRQNHTHSRLLCWTAMDRLVSLVKRGVIQNAPLQQFQETCERIRKQILERGWNEELQSYVSVLDGDDVDACLFLLSWYGFEKADSPRMLSTYRRLRERLGAGNGLIYRYRANPPEGAFAICSFWEAEYLALGGGTISATHEFFRNLLRYKNDLGLYGEEIDPNSGAALGNFPQAFTHIGLIGAALSLQERETGVKQLPHREEEAQGSDAATEVAA